MYKPSREEGLLGTRIAIKKQAIKKLTADMNALSEQLEVLHANNLLKHYGFVQDQKLKANDAFLVWTRSILGEWPFRVARRFMRIIEVEDLLTESDSDYGCICFPGGDRHYVPIEVLMTMEKVADDPA